MDEEFNKVYEKILAESGTVLREIRRKKNRYLAIGFLIAMLVNIPIFILDKSSFFSVSLIIISGAILLILYFNADKDYRKAYKKCVIEEIVKSYNKNLVYVADEGLTDYDYSMSAFEPDFKETISEDKIYGTLLLDTQFKMAQVYSYAMREYKDREGKTQTEKAKTFDGIYGIVRMEEDSKDYIHIKEAESTIDARLARITHKTVEMDSAEFETYYDVITEDRLDAYKIFTPEILEEFVELPKRNITHFEIKIDQNMMYFRYRCGEVFEPPKFKDPLDKETIHTYYNTIVFPIDLTKKIINNIIVKH